MARIRILAGLCAVMLLSTWLVGSAAAAPAPYTDPQGRFSLTVPDGWHKATDDTFDATFEPTGPTMALFAVLVETADKTSGNLNLNAADLKDALGDLFDEVGPITVQPSTLGGQPAQRIDGTGTLDETDLRFTIVILVTGNRTFGLFFFTEAPDYDLLSPAARLFFDSFTLGKATSSTTPTPTIMPATPTPGGLVRRLGDG